MKTAIAGTLESNDALITVKEFNGIKVEIESIVFAQFGKQITKVINDTLKELNVNNIYVHCADKGALDYTLKSRLITAIERLGK